MKALLTGLIGLFLITAMVTTIYADMSVDGSPQGCIEMLDTANPAICSAPGDMTTESELLTICDYDGITELPAQLEDVSSYPYITQGLLDRGYSHDDIRKILGLNALRALRGAEEVAESLNGET